MSSPAIFVEETTSLPELIDLANQEGVRALPVLNTHKQVIGIITDNDLKREISVNLTQLRYMPADQIQQLLQPFRPIQASALMTQPVITVLHTDILSHAVNLLNQHAIKRLPVVDVAGHLLGILTRSDILREIAVSNLPSQPQTQTTFNWDARIEDIPLESCLTLPQETPLPQVVQTMQAHKAKRIVVINQAQAMVGMVTENDLLNRVNESERHQLMNVFSGQQDPTTLTLSPSLQEIMTAPILFTHADALVYDAMRLMIANQIKRLPVLDDAGQIIGMVGRNGLLQAFFNHTSA